MFLETKSKETFIRLINVTTLVRQYLKLKNEKKDISRVGVKIWSKIRNEYKNLSKNSFKDRNKKSSFKYSSD